MTKTITEANFLERRHALLDAMWQNPETRVRVAKKFARELLLRNESIIVNGTVRWFKIQDLGLGVYEVALNKDNKETVLL